MRSDARQCPTTSGFTLIELLVVLSIIALLIALLLPTLQGAKDAAMRVQCLSAIRQLSLHVMVYREDYGALPPYKYSYVPYARPRPDNPQEHEALRKLRIDGVIEPKALACPEGWASTNQEWHFFQQDTPNMDYMYWGSFPRQDDIKFNDEEKRIFAYSIDAPGERLLISDRLQADPTRWPHGSNHERGPLHSIDRMEDGVPTGDINYLDSLGGSQAYLDGHATWYDVTLWNRRYDLRDLAWVDPDAW